MEQSQTDLFLTHFRSLPSTISYDSDATYRQCIRHIFKFAPDKQTFYSGLKKEDLVEEEDLDPESKDEMDLDMDALEDGMNIIYLATHQNPLFRNLYEYAAGRMFSTDPKIGQAVLCSYDTFTLYFSCVWHFFALSDRQLTDSSVKDSSVKDLQEYRQLCSWFSIPV